MFIGLMQLHVKVNDTSSKQKSLICVIKWICTGRRACRVGRSVGVAECWSGGWYRRDNYTVQVSSGSQLTAEPVGG